MVHIQLVQLNPNFRLSKLKETYFKIRSICWIYLVTLEISTISLHSPFPCCFEIFVFINTPTSTFSLLVTVISQSEVWSLLLCACTTATAIHRRTIIWWRWFWSCNYYHSWYIARHHSWYIARHKCPLWSSQNVWLLFWRGTPEASWENEEKEREDRKGHWEAEGSRGDYEACRNNQENWRSYCGEWFVFVRRWWHKWLMKEMKKIEEES